MTRPICCQDGLAFRFSFDDDEREGGQGTHDGQQHQVDVHGDLQRVEEDDGGRDGLEEPEDGEGWGRVVAEDPAEDWKDFGVEAGVAEAEDEGAEDGDVNVWVHYWRLHCGLKVWNNLLTIL